MSGTISIGRFSELTGLSPKTIRLYGSLGLLPPIRVDAFTGYRYYESEQATRARLIARLRQAGVSLREITSFLIDPREEQIDAWERQLEAELATRREHLNAVRRMLSGAVDQTEEVVMTAEQESQQVAPEAAGRIHGLAAVFKVSDVVATGEYYRDKLGFTVNFTWGDPPQYVTTSRGDAAIHFAKGEAPTGHNGEASEAYIFVSGIDALYEEIAGRGVKVLMGLETWPYGMREFAVEDLNGYRLCFGEGIEEEAAGD